MSRFCAIRIAACVAGLAMLCLVAAAALAAPALAEEGVAKLGLTLGANSSQDAQSGQDEQQSEPTEQADLRIEPDASFRGIVAYVGPGQEPSCTVAAQDVNGATYLMLPSGTNLAALSIGLPQPYNTAVQLSASATGPFGTGAFDLRTCRRTSQGAYTMYVRYRAGQQAFPVTVVKSGGVSALFLQSDDPDNRGRAFIEASADHSATATGSYALLSAQGQLANQGDLSLIRGRGNSSWSTLKKPYQIKLAQKASLVDGTPENKAKTWVLISNHYDETLLRNYLAYHTALAMGLGNSPDCTFVDLYYDGEYRGLYLLSEKVQFGTGRVEAEEIENYSNYGTSLDNNATAQGVNSYGYAYQYVKGAVAPALPQQTSYLLELDKSTYLKERCWFQTSAGPVVVKSPDNLSQAQMQFISQQVQRSIDEASKANGNMGAYFDVTSVARVFLVNEFAKNSDWLCYSSTFFYFDNADGLLHAGPVWDFDLAFGVHSYEGRGEYIDVDGWASQTSLFFGSNTQFLQAMRASLTRDALPVLRCWTGASNAGKVPTVAQLAASLKDARAMDQLVWGTAKAGAVSVTHGSHDAAIGYLQQWVAGRVAWMETQGATHPRKGPSGSGLVRLWGSNALATMSAIVDHCRFAAGGTVVLATADGYWDALTAAGLAGFAQAPVLMTSSKGLSAHTAAQLAKLRPATIVVCGGTSALPNSVVQTARLAAAGAGNGGASPTAAQSAAAGRIRLVRCAGATATGTAVDVFSKAPGITGGTWSRTAFVCTNASYHDALAAAPISYACGMPIFLSEGSARFSQATIDAIRMGGITAVYVVGGEAAISAAAVAQLKDAGIAVGGRLAGATAIETSQAVARFGLAKGLSAHNMGVATTKGYWDSLSGAALCGRFNSVLVLASNQASSSIGGFVADHASQISRIYLFGGTAALSQDTAEAVRKAASVAG